MSLPEELKAMLAKARRYLDSAEVLWRHQDYDSAISRLYYAMFYCAEALLYAKGYSFSSHKAVISAFAQHFVKTALLPKEFHQWLREAFEKRQISDYTFATPASDTHVRDLKTKAEQFLLRTEEWLQGKGLL